MYVSTVYINMHKCPQNTYTQLYIINNYTNKTKTYTITYTITQNFLIFKVGTAYT